MKKTELNKLNRKNHFYRLFIMANTSPTEVAKKLNITKDALYRKIVGTNGFSESDINKILDILKMSYENVFIRKVD